MDANEHDLDVIEAKDERMVGREKGIKQRTLDVNIFVEQHETKKRNG